MKNKIKKYDDEINYIIDSIKIIDRQICEFENLRFFFLRKIKIKQYQDRIEKLENVKKALFKRLQHIMDKE